MPNRYAGKYDDYIAKIKQQSFQDPREQHRADNERDFKQTLGNIASIGMPVVGAAIGGAVGGVPGATIGGNIGNAAGQATGQAMYNQGEQAEDPIRKRELERQALLQAIYGLKH